MTDPILVLFLSLAAIIVLFVICDIAAQIIGRVAAWIRLRWYQ